MIEIKVTSADLGTLSWPHDMRRDIFLAYYDWIKADKNPLEFEYTHNLSLAEYEKFMSDTAWIK